MAAEVSSPLELLLQSSSRSSFVQLHVHVHSLIQGDFAALATMSQKNLQRTAGTHRCGEAGSWRSVLIHVTPIQGKSPSAWALAVCCIISPQQTGSPMHIATTVSKPHTVSRRCNVSGRDWRCQRSTHPRCNRQSGRWLPILMGFNARSHLRIFPICRADFCKLQPAKVG